jgi:opacity protein-like surface antigen
MRSLKLALLATAAVAALSSAAAAADLIVDVPIEEPIIDNSFSFDGAYVGLFLHGQTGGFVDAFGVGANLGVNVLMDGLLVGAELEGVVATGPNYSAQLTGRVGGLISDNAIVYAYSGLGSRTPTSWYVPIGIGAEVAVADNVGIKGEVQYNWDLTGPAAQNSFAAKVGLNFHF